MKYRENLSHLSLCCFVIYVYIEREQALRGAVAVGGGGGGGEGVRKKGDFASTSP